MPEPRPSGAGRWVYCPPSAMLPDPPQVLAAPRDKRDEGILAHAVALEGRRSEAVTPDMLRGAELLAQVIGGVGGEVRIERRVRMPWGSVGRVDFWAVQGTTLTVGDYKFGRAPDPAVGNWQLLAYALGLTTDPVAAHECPEVKGVQDLRLIVVAPRSVTGALVQEWRVRVEDAVEHWDRLRAAASSALQNPDGPRTAGLPQCTYCPQRAECPELRGAVLRGVLIQAAGPGLEEEGQNPGIELSLLTHAVELAQERLLALQEKVRYMLVRGGAPTELGWRMSPGRGATVWTVPPATVARVGDLAGVQVLQPPEAVTPLQAVAAGLPEEVVASMSERRPGKLKLEALKAPVLLNEGVS